MNELEVGAVIFIALLMVVMFAAGIGAEVIMGRSSRRRKEEQMSKLIDRWMK